VFLMNLSNIVKEEGMQFAYPWQDMQEESDNSKDIINSSNCPEGS
ncbi:MAG: hypothetical protein H6Q68_4018, partial [Firmicutes bacterium]|nr:hypothetical protein [Bacillota bacterium]